MMLFSIGETFSRGSLSILQGLTNLPSNAITPLGSLAGAGSLSKKLSKTQWTSRGSLLCTLSSICIVAIVFVGACIETLSNAQNMSQVPLLASTQKDMEIFVAHYYFA